MKKILIEKLKRFIKMKKMMIAAILVLISLLAGCAGKAVCPEPETIIEKVPIRGTITETVYVNNTVYVENCTTNITVYESNSSYILSLIQRVQWLESQQNDYFVRYENISECEADLAECNATLDEFRELLE